MVVDTVQTDKQLRDSDEIVKSLLVLRDEVFEKVKGTPASGPDSLLFIIIINQILYRGDAHISINRKESAEK